MAVQTHYERLAPVFDVTLFVAKLHLQSDLIAGMRLVEHVLHSLVCEHSNCYTKMLLQLLAGIYQFDVKTLRERMVRQCRMLSYVHLLLGRTTSYDMLQVIMELLALVYIHDKEQAPRVLYMIAAHFKKLNLSKHQSRKVSRSISDTGSELLPRKIVRRESLCLTVEERTTIESIPILTERIRLRKKKLGNHRPLMTAIMSMAVWRPNLSS